MGILTKAVKAAAKKRLAAAAKKKAAEVAARKKAAAARVSVKAAAKKLELERAARKKIEATYANLKGSSESLDSKLRKEAKANAAKDGPKKTGGTTGKKKDTPEAAITDRERIVQHREARAAKANQAATQRKGSIAKKQTVTKTDIRQAEDKIALDAYENKVDDMASGDIKSELKRFIKAKRKAFENMQAAERDKSVRKSTQGGRDKKPFKGYDPSKDLPFNKGGMATKKKSTGYMYGGMAKKPKAKK